MKVFQRILCVIVLLVINNPIILAQKTWTGASDSNWANASNWNPVGVPGATHNVFITNAVNIAILQSGTTASIKAITIQSNATLTIQSNAVLNIDGSTNHGIENIATLNNAGEINIGGSLGINNNGITNNGGTFTNELNAEVNIDQVDADGIYNQNGATFVNKGKIDMGSTATIGSDGIENEGDFTNEVGAEINIDQVNSDGIDLESTGTFTNKGKINIGSTTAIGDKGIENDGDFTNEAGAEINIDQVGSDGIILGSVGTFMNKGKINIGSTTAIGDNGIFNKGDFTNEAGAEINIDEVSLDGISLGSAGTFMNKGKINIGSITTIDSDGIENNGDFTNEVGAEINIDQVNSDGIDLESTGTFTNKGKINIGSTTAIGDNGIENNGDFTNEVGAEININRTTNNGILNSSSITNKAIIRIGGINTIGTHGLYSVTGANFINEIGATLHINHTGQNGITNFGATFTNKAIILIGRQYSIGNNGVENLLGATFTNDTGAELRIESGQNIGLANNDATFINKESIYIEGVGAGSVGYGLYSIIGADFINETGAELHIDQTNLDGIYNYFSSPSILNKACAKIFITEKINNNETFTNLGFIFSDFNGSHVNTGTFTNQGTIEDLQGAFNGVSMNNEDLILAPVCGNVVIPNVLQIGTNNSFTVSTDWYSDAALTTDVGDYNQSSNTFTSNLPAGSHTFYMEITDNVNTCTETVAIQVSAKPNPSITGTLSYCSGGNTTLDAGNWNSYAWSNNQTSQAITAIAGTYTVTVTSSNGCTGTDQVTVTANPNLNPSITGNLTYCSGGNTTLDAGNWTSYLWSNTQTTQTTTATQGTYTVTVSDANACTGTAMASVTANSNLNPSITGNLTYCSGGNTTLNAGNWTSYLWSNTQTTQTTTATQGTYTVTVADANACTGTAVASVTANPNPSPSITGSLTYPSGGNTILDAGNWSGYVWSNTLTSQSITATQGTYTVTVSNSNGCTGTATAQVMVATSCSAEAGILSSNAATICSGDAVELQTIGEETATNYLQYFFVYAQDNLGNTTFVSSQAAVNSSASFAGLASGDYLVCAYSENQSNVPNPSPITTTPNLDDIYDTGIVQTGCFDIECSTISVSDAFAPNLTSTGQAQENNSTGSNIYTVEVCGGTAPYDADFSFSGGFASVEELPSENSGCTNYQIVYTDPTDWTLTVTDANNCSNSDVVFTNDGLPSNPLPQITEVVMSPETCVGDEDGSITIEVEGGDGGCGDYTYTWSGTNGFSSIVTGNTTGNMVNNLASGFYNVMVTDCAGTTTVQDIYLSRTNGGGGRGRGRGGCKTAGENLHDLASLKAFPNPFSQITSIEFSIAETSKVWISIYSVEGRKVAEILTGESIEGNTAQRLGFDAEELQNGVYILELQTESGLRQHQQLVVVK